jgi:signal transduction histidine kinase
MRKGKAVERMMSDMFSHQLRTPLTAITGYISLLREGAFGTLSSEQEDIIRVISKNVWRINILLDDFKDLESIEGGGLTLSKSLISVEELLGPVIRDIRSGAKEKGIQFTDDIDVDLKVFVDVEAIRRAFIHITHNSVNYTQSGKVTIETDTEGMYSVIRVIDTGIGIGDEDRANIFTKYYRSANPYVRENPGAGLGLYIARACIESHGGSIEVESKPDNGTVTTVKLPTLPLSAEN